MTPSEVFGPYLIYEQLGIGGMAQVHRAEHAIAAESSGPAFHRPIALKRMLPHMAANREMVRSFVREAHLASHLHHANVCQTYELGKVGDVYFIAMELIRGRNLRAVLKRCAQTTGPMPVPVALNILNQICDALDYAHNLCDATGKPLGIIHRDVSPANVIVAEGGVVKLIDFGIAKVTSADVQTMSGMVKGKFGYMAPEYLAGRIDARADLFALGVIAHELLTNRPLFSTADDVETLNRLRGMEIAPPSRTNPHVPAEIDDIVMTALERDPDHRWQHATALRTAMTTVTHRLGLAMTNPAAVEWIDWLFAQPDHPAAARPTIVIESDPSLEIIQVKTTPVAAHASGGLAPARVEAEPEYRAAVAAFERHHALVPGAHVVTLPRNIRGSTSPANTTTTLAGAAPPPQLAKKSAPLPVPTPPPAAAPARSNVGWMVVAGLLAAVIAVTIFLAFS